MRIFALTPPGRFPTVIYDPGGWWPRLAATGRHRIHWLSANTTWWYLLCSGAAVDIVCPAAHGFFEQRRRTTLSDFATLAGGTLGVLQRASAYDTSARYIRAVSPLARYLKLLNGRQRRFRFGVDFGVRVTDLDYGDSEALVNYARSPSPLSDLIDRSLADAPAEIDLVVIAVQRAEELLTAMIAVLLLRSGRPKLHACLADHGHEQFSLGPHLSLLRRAATLDSVFDTIVETKADRDTLVFSVAESIVCGRPLRGYLGKGNTAAISPESSQLHECSIAPPPFQTFSPEPIYWTRLSPRRCYWNKCTFCALNAKHSESNATSLDDVLQALDRISTLTRAGYRTINFGDEALSPALLDRLARGILERGLQFRWACCCKFEQTFTAHLFRSMRAAGCYEVFWGLETASERLIVLMGKHVPGLDLNGRRHILKAASEAGIGTHVSLMAGFPGDSPAQAAASVDFVINTLADLRHATFNLNRFELRPGSPIADSPAAFGIIPETPVGDMPTKYRFGVSPQLRSSWQAVNRMIPKLHGRLYSGLGWNRFTRDAAREMALALHFFFGHGSVIKQREEHDFANQRKDMSRPKSFRHVIEVLRSDAGRDHSDCASQSNPEQRGHLTETKFT